MFALQSLQSIVKYSQKNYFLTFTFYITPDLVRDEYRCYQNKRLANIMKTLTTKSTFHCTTWCSMTDGCLAVNIVGNHDIICELTTGLSNETEMRADSSSELFVLGMVKRD